MSDGEEEYLEGEEEEEDIPGEAAEMEVEGGEEEGEEEGEQEEEEKIPDLPLTEETVAECLSLLSRIGHGLAHAYVRLDIHEKDITDISILHRFIHLRYVEMSRNNLKDISALSPLSHMLTLKVENNLLQTVKLEELPYLQYASFARNKLTSAEGLNHPMLEHLILNFNELKIVQGLDPGQLKALHTLELRGNKLTTTSGLGLPCLKSLFLGGNLIKKLEGLDALVSLTTLHLRDNQISQLDGFSESLENLNYINLRGNLVTAVAEIKKLGCLPKLKALVMSDSPVSEEEEYRMEALYHIKPLIRLDKDQLMEEEKDEIKVLYEQRQAEQAKAAEEAAANAEVNQEQVQEE